MPNCTLLYVHRKDPISRWNITDTFSYMLIQLYSACCSACAQHPGASNKLDIMISVLYSLRLLLSLCCIHWDYCSRKYWFVKIFIFNPGLFSYKIVSSCFFAVFISTYTWKCFYHLCMNMDIVLQQFVCTIETCTHLNWHILILFRVSGPEFRFYMYFICLARWFRFFRSCPDWIFRPLQDSNSSGNKPQKMKWIFVTIFH
jgi:hypothetical protein